MAIETYHPKYISLQQKWSRCRDCYQGQDAIYYAGEKYLPRIEGQTDNQYSSYKKRTRFFNAYRRTIDNMTGIAFRKMPIISNDETGITENIDGQGNTLAEYSKQLLSEILITDFSATLIDFPQIEQGISVAEAERLNANPVFVRYHAEQIINWKFHTINNITLLKMVVLAEQYDNSSDEFEQEYKIRYRVLDLENGQYRQRVYIDETLVSEVFPKMNGQPINRIPIVFHGYCNNPPLIDLADTNIKHYQIKADHTHGLRYVALPTPVISGIDKDNAPDTIGPQKLWILENPDASAYMLEFTGSGLGAYEKELKEIEMSMSQLGARLLDDAVQPKTATEASINSQHSNASLLNIINKLENDLNQSLILLSNWAGIDEIEIEMNKDFIPAPMEPNRLLALMSLWQNGGISYDTLFYNLQKGEVIASGNNPENEKDAIEIEIPPLSTTTSQFGN